MPLRATWGLIVSRCPEQSEELFDETPFHQQVRSISDRCKSNSKLSFSVGQRGHQSNWSVKAGAHMPSEIMLSNCKWVSPCKWQWPAVSFYPHWIFLLVRFRQSNLFSVHPPGQRPAHQTGIRDRLLLKVQPGPGNWEGSVLKTICPGLNVNPQTRSVSHMQQEDFFPVAEYPN